MSKRTVRAAKVAAAVGRLHEAREIILLRAIALADSGASATRFERLRQAVAEYNFALLEMKAATSASGPGQTQEKK